MRKRDSVSRHSGSMSSAEMIMGIISLSSLKTRWDLNFCTTRVFFGFLNTLSGQV